MSAIEAILEKLKPYPELRLDLEPGSVGVIPRYGDGFYVVIQEQRFRYLVRLHCFSFGFAKDEDGVSSAVDLFLFGLSKYCRIKTISEGEAERGYEIEFLRDGEWIKGASLGRGATAENDLTVAYLQNHVAVLGDLSGRFLNIMNERKRIQAHFYYLVVSVVVIGLCIKSYPSTALLFPGYIVIWALGNNAVDSWCDKQISVASGSVRSTFRLTRFHYLLASWIGIWGLVGGGLYSNYGSDLLAFLLVLWPFVLVLFLLPLLLVNIRLKR